LVEAAATNSVANARAGGAVVGTPGTLPTGFTIAGAPLALAEITFVGIEDGLPCVELRIAGTLGAAGDVDIAFTTTTATPALLNDVFTGSFFWRLISGTVPTNWRMRFEEYASGGALLVGNQVDLSPATNAALRGQRASSAYTVANASAAFLRHVMRLRFAAGAVNTTLRIAVPQLERGSVATSPILNPVGAPAATTRAADQRYVATVAERRARVLARLIEKFEPTPAAIIGLAARLGDTVTLTEFRPYDCEDDCEALLLDEPWAHAFQVAGGAQLVVEFTCEDGCETPLSQWRTGAYECAIRRFAPAHTVPIFSYGAPLPPPPPVYYAEYVLIAGGAAGGRNAAGGSFGGGGGAAGGYRSNRAGELSGGGAPAEAPFPITLGLNYPVVIGEGGIAAGALGGPGQNSVFGGITALGGGPGRGAAGNGGDGGSGGGAGANGGGNTGGNGTSGQGFNGGGVPASGSGPYPAGGGAGAGEAGQAASGRANGKGGDGVLSSITGTPVRRAAGGGGGAYEGDAGGPVTRGLGGQGGGGDGSLTSGTVNTTPGTAGQDGTGSGGGNAANGGRGVLILRYPNTLTLTNPGGGLTISFAAVGGDTVATISSGSGNIQWN
jgi:hypothetical protein